MMKTCRSKEKRKNVVQVPPKTTLLTCDVIRQQPTKKLAHFFSNRLRALRHSSRNFPDYFVAIPFCPQPPRSSSFCVRKQRYAKTLFASIICPTYRKY